MSNTLRITVVTSLSFLAQVSHGLYARCERGESTQGFAQLVVTNIVLPLRDTACPAAILSHLFVLWVVRCTCTLYAGCEGARYLIIYCSPLRAALPKLRSSCSPPSFIWPGAPSFLCQHEDHHLLFLCSLLLLLVYFCRTYHPGEL